MHFLLQLSIVTVFKSVLGNVKCILFCLKTLDLVLPIKRIKFNFIGYLISVVIDITFVVFHFYISLIFLRIIKIKRNDPIQNAKKTENNILVCCLKTIIIKLGNISVQIKLHNQILTKKFEPCNNKACFTQTSLV